MAVVLNASGEGLLILDWSIRPVDRSRTADMAQARRETERLRAALPVGHPSERAQALVDGLTAQIAVHDAARANAWGHNEPAYDGHDWAASRLREMRAKLIEAAQIILGHGVVKIQKEAA